MSKYMSASKYTDKLVFSDCAEELNYGSYATFNRTPGRNFGKRFSSIKNSIVRNVPRVYFPKHEQLIIDCNRHFND